MVFSEDPWECAAACWALAWLGECQVWVPPAQPDILGRFYTLSRNAQLGNAKRFAAWALTSQVLAPREEGGRCMSVPQADLVPAPQDSESRSALERHALLIIAWYRRTLSDAELLRRARKLLESKQYRVETTLKQIVASLSKGAPSGQKSRKRKT
jgi:hypothetical protein